MATAQEQARYRARDSKTLVQIRLHPETVERLDQMVREQRASGRAEIIEGLLSDDPRALGKLGSHLMRRYFRLTGRTRGTARDEHGVVDMRIEYFPDAD